LPPALLACHSTDFTYFFGLVCGGGRVDREQPHIFCRPVTSVLHRLSLFTIPEEHHRGQHMDIALYGQIEVVRTVHRSGHDAMATLQRGGDVSKHRFYRPTISAPCEKLHYTH